MRNPWDQLLDAAHSPAVPLDRSLLDFALDPLIAVLPQALGEDAKDSTMGALDGEEMLKASVAILCRPAIAHRIDQLVRLAARIGLIPGAVAALELPGVAEVPLVSATWCSPYEGDLRPTAIHTGSSTTDSWVRTLPVGARLEAAVGLVALDFELASEVQANLEGSCS